MTAITVSAAILALLVLARGGPRSGLRLPRRPSGATKHPRAAQQGNHLVRAALGAIILAVAVLGPAVVRLVT